MKRRWTKADDAFLVRVYGVTALSTREIAQLLGRSVQAVGYHARTLGLRMSGADWRLVELDEEGVAA